MVIEYGLWYYIVLVDSRVGRGRSRPHDTSRELLGSPDMRAPLADEHCMLAARPCSAKR